MALTWILQAIVTLRLWVTRVQDLLGDVLRHDLVEHIVCGQGQGLLVEQQSLGQQRVQIVRRHHVVLASVENTKRNKRRRYN